jgi:class III poly(R)-hydroxyalkanoic acid synthase PhaE subunit
MHEVSMSNENGTTLYWSDVYLKGQEEFLKRWNDWASQTAAAGANAGAPGMGAGSAGFAGPFGMTDGWPNWAQMFGTAMPSQGADVLQKWFAMYEPFLSATRGLTEAYSRALAQPDPIARAQEFGNALLQSQQQFTSTWQSLFMLDPKAAGASGLGAAIAGGMPWLAAWQRDMGAGRLSMADLPALGPTRERQEAMQRLQRLFADYFEQHGALAGLWNEVMTDGLKRLGELMGTRFRDGQLPQSGKQLYDLWVESGEAAYAQMAHSPRYAKVQAELGNTLAKIRIEQRGLVESVSRELDLPTRSELNSVHKRIKDMKAELRRLRAELDRAKPPRSSARAATKPRTDLPN